MAEARWWVVGFDCIQGRSRLLTAIDSEVQVLLRDWSCCSAGQSPRFVSVTLPLRRLRRFLESGGRGADSPAFQIQRARALEGPECQLNDALFSAYPSQALFSCIRADPRCAGLDQCRDLCGSIEQSKRTPSRLASLCVFELSSCLRELL